MNLSVDLNADLGEGAAHDAELFELISSANIATGFHAGDADTMHAAVSTAKACGVAVGAHPSLFDRENFGRKELKVSAEEVFDAVTYQLGVSSDSCGHWNTIKPHQTARLALQYGDARSKTGRCDCARHEICRSKIDFVCAR